ncbi:MAG: hypothetical protein H6662_06410 [Ardenticatenaceae bacterium]|nr:hypothetical protein [Ardenticatenaceae bacterium]MCB9004270.1 hypothetical protein [Ardenticatenaceae bacterium]
MVIDAEDGAALAGRRVGGDGVFGYVHDTAVLLQPLQTLVALAALFG